jgi:lysophospholipase L1-like esterase
MKGYPMKRILCYGDSNTWGYDPVSGDRYEREIRWTGVLRAALENIEGGGPGYEIIEEGLNGRTTVWEDPIEGYKNGYSYLIPCLETHRPLDLVILMLGTNDLKKRFDVPAFDIAEGAGVLVGVVQKSAAGHNGSDPPVLLMAPPPVAKLTAFAEMFEGAEQKSRRLGEHYRRMAQQSSCAFLDTASVIHSSDVDGIHFDISEHRKLGLAVAEIVQTLVG